MERSLAGSLLITPSQGEALLQTYEQSRPFACSPQNIRTKTTVENLATVGAIRRLYREDKTTIGVLNFASQGATHLVLGAYGCGVFRNDPEKIAAWWQELLEEGLGDCFDSVFHAVLDRSKNQACIRAFEEICGLGTYPIGVPTSMRFPSGS